MDYLNLVAVEKFAERLKINFPVLLNPKDFTDRMLNIANENTLRRIDLAVDWARLEFSEQAEKEAREYGKSKNV